MKNVFLLDTIKEGLVSRSGMWSIGELMLQGVVFPTKASKLKLGLVEIDGRLYSVTDPCPPEYVNTDVGQSAINLPFPMLLVK